MEQFLFGVILTLLAFTVASTTDWVEITQRPQNVGNSSESLKKIIKKSNSNAVNDDLPSPNWIEYQRERFSNKRLRNSSSQKLVVSGGGNLKTSAKIIVPATQVQNNNDFDNVTIAKKNRFFRAKTRLEVENDKPNVELVELPHFEQQTTPRRSSLDDDVSVDDEESTAEESLADYVDENHNNEEGETSSNNHEGTNQMQLPSLQGFIKFLKGLHKTWLKKSTFEDKIKMLKKLRDSLMQKIEEQFSALWPFEDSESRQRRNRRSILDESNLNFPPEAALMSINFLTFAVFLIKLVLQVINIVKSKHYSFSGLQMNTDSMVKTNVLHS